MGPIRLRRVMFLEKLQQLEQAGRGQNKTISKNLIFKLGRKLSTLGATIYFYESTAFGLNSFWY